MSQTSQSDPLRRPVRRGGVPMQRKRKRLPFAPSCRPPHPPLPKESASSPQSRAARASSRVGVSLPSRSYGLAPRWVASRATRRSCDPRSSRNTTRSRRDTAARSTAANGSVAKIARARGVSLAAHPGENKPRAKRSPRLREFRTNASGGARPREVTVFHPTNAPSPHISPTRGGSDFSRPAPRLM